ncbi:MAG: hypothetical protein DWQ04_26850 [Chloroflexi bacterium]|nr:MAG: hypothetical protein DWQ04_26850 [Chloroflexota bacterium]
MNQKSFWTRISYLFVLMLSVACGGGNPAPLIEDSYEIVTLTPGPTRTPSPTEAPVTEDANGIALAFYRAWEGLDYLGMYSLLAPSNQAIIDSQSFTTLYDETMTTAAVQTLHAQPLAVSQEGSTAEFSVRVTWETAVIGSITRDFTVPLLFENGRWGIIWDEGLILPEMAGGNRLFLDYRIPSRANIYDINGLALAYQGTIFTLGVIPGQIEDEEGMLINLSPILNLSPEEIKAIYAPAQPDWYWPIGEIPEETLQQYITALQPYIGKGLAQPEPRLARLYSDDGVAPHIVGYTGYIPAETLADYQLQGYRGDEQVGLAGIERWGEDYLNGERGGMLTVVGPSGEYISTVQERESKQARSVYTTLDRDFQKSVEEALAYAIETHPVGNRGAVVVIDVNTGAIRAMASYPTYSPTIFDLARPDADVELGQVLSNPANPLVNRVTQGAYPAGSLFKVVTFTAAVNSGLYTPESTYTSTGTWERLGENFVKTDWSETGHGTVSLAQALVVSCNSCFYDAAYNMDFQDNFFFSNTAKEFGLSSATGIEGAAENSGLIPDPEWKLANVGEGWATGDAVNMGIGQGYVQVTPLQMATIFAALANGGTIPQPTLIDRIGSGGGAPEELWPSQNKGQLPLSPEHLATIQNSLWNVANSEAGTAVDRFIGLPVPVAGKTGTAEAPPNSPHAWFAGYAPAASYTRSDGLTLNEPEIAVVVIVENAGEGSEVSAPIFRRIVELYYGVTPLQPLPWE